MTSPPREGGSGFQRVLLLFLDGVGTDPEDPGLNPFFSARLPSLRTLLGGTLPTLEAPEVGTPTGVAFPLDPLLGIDGLPQSGTGQTALLTGENAPALYGRHFGPWVPVSLRPLLATHNVLSRAKEAGVSCAFANAYPSFFGQTPWAKRPAAPPLAAQAAGVLCRDEETLARGEAVASEIVNTSWRERLGFLNLPDVTPRKAGKTLAEISVQVELTLFAHYSTDFAGHKKSMAPAVQALERVDDFLGGLVTDLPPDALLVVASDHGNLEDVTQGHTRNPTLAILAGPGAPQLKQGLTSITDLAGFILGVLGVGS